MHRLAISMLFTLIAAGLMAAPAPVRRNPWATGWDRPVDTVGDCRFDHRGDTLTVTVPGKGHDLDIRGGRLDAPHLLRPVEGDFRVQVRAGGAAAGRPVGLLLRGGDADPMITLQFTVTQPRRCNVLAVVSRKGGGPALRVGTYDGPPLGVSAWLRLERRGNVGTAAFSEDGKNWTTFNVPLEIALPRKGKVGVVAVSTADGTFKAVFDRFVLTPLAERKR
jgi:regulation of enolase protein 1 (concanavalin A-like superfamily)